MYQSLDLFSTAFAMARHAGARQAVVAGNMANADTPGYRARALEEFSETLRQGQASAPRRSRPGHLAGAETAAVGRITLRPGEAAPNGNTVSVETEMMDAARIQQQQSRALAVYRHAMGVIRSSLG